MSHYSARSPLPKKAFAVKESSLGTGTEIRTPRQASSHEEDEQAIPYLPFLTHNRIFKMVKETRGRLHGSRRDNFSRLDSVKSLTPMMASLTPKSTPCPGETVMSFLPKAPLSSLERFLELSNQSSIPSPRKFLAQADCQRALSRRVLPTPRLFEKSPTHHDKHSSNTYVKFTQIRFQDGKADVVKKRSRCVFCSSPEHLKKGKTKQAFPKDVKPTANDYATPVDVGMHFVRRPLMNSAA